MLPTKFQQTWPPHAILISDWSISKTIFSFETAYPYEPKLGRKHLHVWKVLYEVSSQQNERWATQAQPPEPLVLLLLMLVNWIYYIMCAKNHWGKIVMFLMSRKFKQWWSIIPPILTKQTIISHLRSLNIKKTETYDNGIQVIYIFLFIVKNNY
jgi:hypothetical protein